MRVKLNSPYGELKGPGDLTKARNGAEGEATGERNGKRPVLFDHLTYPIDVPDHWLTEIK